MLENPYRELDDDTLLTGTKQAADNERYEGADMILRLMAILERRLYAVEYSSLYTYCVRKLGFSKGTAYRRSKVASAAERFPELIERLEDGRLLLCAAAFVVPHLTEANVTEILDAVVGLSKDEAETYIVKRRAVVTPAREVRPTGGAAETPQRETRPVAPEAPMPLPQPPPPPPTAPLPRTVTRQVTPEAKRMNVSIRDKTYEAFRRLKELMPGKSDDEILSVAFEGLLEKRDPLRRHARREAKAIKKPAKIPTRKQALAPSTARRGSLAARDAAVAASGGRCEHMGPSGNRCSARAFTQLDHVRPFALGGRSTMANFRELCFTHHQLRTEASFGKWKQSKTLPICPEIGRPARI